jgi:hypothetical protein
MSAPLGQIRFPVALALAAALVALLPAPASGHSRPPSSTWKRCKTLGIYQGAKTFAGTVYAAKNTATYYRVRIAPVFPFGWSGTVTANGNTHSRIWIFATRRHWFHSTIVFTHPLYGRYGYKIHVSPNPGVFNAYGAELWAPYRCS